MLASAALVAGAAACNSGSGSAGSPDSSGTAASSDPPVTPAEPLRFYPVVRESQGTCPAGKASYIRDGHSDSCLRLAAPALTVTQLRSARATQIEGGTWAVQIVLRPADRARFGTLTKKLSTNQSPRNKLALVLGTAPGGRLLTAPVVMSQISTGSVQITGGFTKSSAQRLVHDLGA